MSGNARKGKQTGRVITFASAAALLAVVATVASNIDGVVRFGQKYLLPILAPKAVIDISVGGDPNRTVLLGLNSPTDDKTALEGAFVKGGTSHQFSVTANTYYQVTWQGSGIQLARSDPLLVVAPAVKLRLDPSGGTSDSQQFKLGYVDSGSDIALSAAVPASLIVSAAATATSAEPNSTPSLPPSFPEFDRAATIIGLFETGTTDCSRLIYITKFGASVGCFSASAPGALSRIIAELDGTEGGLAKLVSADDAQTLRALAANTSLGPSSSSDAANTASAMSHVAGRLEFWATYQRVLLEYYRRSLELAGEQGIVSERGVLLVFSAVIQQGPGGFRRAAVGATEKIAAKQANGEEITELVRITALAEAMGNDRFMQFPANKQRLQLLSTGHLTRGGIQYDLDQLGVSLKPLLSDHPPTIKQIGGGTAPVEPAPQPAPAAVSCDKVADEVSKVAVEHLGVEAAKVIPQAKFVDDLGADDLDLVELQMAVEERFQIELGDPKPDSSVESLESEVRGKLGCGS